MLYPWPITFCQNVIRRKPYKSKWYSVNNQLGLKTLNEIFLNIYSSLLADDNSTFSELTTEHNSSENSSPETSLRDLSGLHPMVYQLPVTSTFRTNSSTTSLLTPITSCPLIVSPEPTMTHLIVHTPPEPTSKHLESPAILSNEPLEKLPSISTTMWWPLPAMQQKWLSGLSLLLIVGSSLLQRWSRSRSRSAFGADDRNQDRAFVDTTLAGGRPPLVRAGQLAKYCHSGFPDSQSFVPPFFCDQLSNFEARFPFSSSICWSFGVIALIICSYKWGKQILAFHAKHSKSISVRI